MEELGVLREATLTSYHRMEILKLDIGGIEELADGAGRIL
jgi:hypothetical protein